MVITLTGLSILGVAPPEPTGLCSKRPMSRDLAKQNLLAIGDVHIDSGTPNRSKRINKEAGALAEAREETIYTAATVE